MELFLGILIGIPLGVGLTIVWALCRISAAQENWIGRGGMSKKRQKGCWVRLGDLSGAAAWRWVAEAEPIALGGWGILALYLHRDLTDSEYWSITEASSGRRVGWGPTRKDVITSATKRLAWRGLAKVQAAIAAALEANGPPPERPQSSQGVNAQAVLDVGRGERSDVP